MEHALIFFIQLLGVSLHVLQKVFELDKLLPDDTIADVFKMFWKQDKVTVLISAVITVAFGVFYFVTTEYAPKSVSGYEYLDLIFFGLSFVIGYGGQNIVYKFLGKSVEFANKKIDEKLS